MQVYSRFFFILLLLLISSLLCAQKKDLKVGGGVQKIELSSRALRLEMDDFFVQFAGEIEQAADSILLLSKEKSVREQALLWKTYAIPAAQRATMQRDPFSSLIDAAVLCFQMSDYFNKGKGENAFGAQQEIARKTIALLIDEIRSIGESLSKDRDISDGEALLRNYAKEHPLQSIYFVRKNAAYLSDTYLRVEKIGFKKLAKNVSANMEDLINRLNVYTENLPKQVRWQSELLIAELLNELEAEGKIDSMANLIFAKTDSLIAGQLNHINEMVNQSLAVVDSQRMLVTNDLVSEREIILQTVRKERLETLAELKRERAIILDFISEEKNAAFQKMDSLAAGNIDLTLNGINSIASQNIDASFAETEQLLDQLFKRVYWVLGFVFVGGLVFVFLAQRIRRGNQH
jgi:hypothetical protein